jgi:hypothetical protein
MSWDESDEEFMQLVHDLDEEMGGYASADIHRPTVNDPPQASAPCAQGLHRHGDATHASGDEAARPELYSPLRRYFMSHAWKQLQLAVKTLAEAGSQRERLRRAAQNNLAKLRPRDLPAEIRSDFVALTEEIGLCHALRGTDAMESRIDALDDPAINLIIASIIGMYDAVARYEPIPATAERRQTPR